MNQYARGWTKELDERVTQLHNEGYARKTIGRMINRSRNAVDRHMDRLGLKPHKSKRKRRVVHSFRWPERVDFDRLAELFERDKHDCAGGCGLKTRFKRCYYCNLREFGGKRRVA